MADPIDADADKRHPQLDDSCRGNKLSDSSILPYDHKASVARRRRIELRRLKCMSSAGQPGSKRSRSAISTAASTTTTSDVATEWTDVVTGLNCKADLAVVTRSISSLPADDVEVSPVAPGLSCVQPEMSRPMKTGNEDETASASTVSNDTQACSATSNNCSREVEEVCVTPSERCQVITGAPNITNAAELEERSLKDVGRHYSEDNPALNGMSDESHAGDQSSSGSWESRGSTSNAVLLEEGRSEQEPTLTLARSMQKAALEQHSHEHVGQDREGSWTAESSEAFGVNTSTSTVDLPSLSSLPASGTFVHPDARADAEVLELPTGVKSVRGRRKEMEDAVTVVHRFFSLPCKLVGCCTGAYGAESSRSWTDNCDLHFFGVYDGHGGAQVAHHCREHLHRALAEEVRVRMNADDFPLLERSSSRNGSSNSVDCWKEFWERAMNDCFVRMDQEVGEGEPVAPETVGSTAVVAVVSACQIIVANCGDSRAVLSRGGQAIALSVDQKPERGDELVRIEAAGGRVICWNGYRVFGVLAMSRAIGDRFLKPSVIADPEVTYTERCEEDECLILASDGLWDVLSNEQACEMARRSMMAGGAAAQAAAAHLTSAALEKGSTDNITVVVVDLRSKSGGLRPL